MPISKKLLKKLYIEEEKSSIEIGKELKVSSSLVCIYLRRYNLNRNISESNKLAFKHKRRFAPKNFNNEYARKYKFNQNFFKSWNSKMAYILGLIITDGHITKRDNALIIVQKDKKLLIEIRKIIGPTSILPSNGSWRLSYSSIIMKQDLKNLGIENKYFSLAEMSKISNIFLPHFIRGILDGDGYVCFSRTDKKWISGFVASRKDFLIWLTKKIPIKGGHIGLQSKANCYTLQLGKRDTISLGKFLYTDLSKNDLRLERKKVLFDKSFL